jgi:hypothetical protein
MVNSAGNIDVYGDCSAGHPLACCNSPTKARFAGFTTSTTTGAASGRWKMHALCSAAFTGAHMCHASEYIRASSGGSVPSSGAWIDPSTVNGSDIANSGMTQSARYIGGYACSSWTATGGGDYGTTVNTAGNIDVYGDCSSARAIACCL